MLVVGSTGLIAPICKMAGGRVISNKSLRDGGFTYVALAADGLLAVVLGGKGLQGRLNDTTTQTEDQVKGGLL